MNKKSSHTTYCNYMVEKASKTRTMTVKAETEKRIPGIKTLGYSRNELILALAN